ncbi:hypothetical protein Afil01_34300 [Actinorhabdospora filicis]|uniref:DUF998 domain-containing protein n=1 Tax=Actinorhabdospora filicis TaxID=1785913 RepID=A0A9W6WA33_9ACTN|nr:DUF998 domain-containing protein [Actinorhabdospora filicis]GLZ78623.1 hypothetical protein Afil01_34300 [Actinorhabdospora filicis]
MLTHPSRARFAAYAWILLVLFFVVQAIAQAASTAPYSFTGQFVSDLGNTACGPWEYFTDGSVVEICSPAHGLVNASFALSGILLAAGTLLAWRSWPARRAVTVAKVLLVVAGTGWVVVSLAPENENLTAHGLGAMMMLAGGSAAMILLGASLRQWWTLAAGVIAAAATVLTLAQAYLGLGLGVMERLAVFPLLLWAIGTGVTRLRR